MTTRSFQGVPFILTLSCSGRVLPPDTKLMALDLFTVVPSAPLHPLHHQPHYLHPPPENNDDNDENKDNNNDNNNNNKIIASMDLLDGECYTSDSFSSCDIVDRDSRRSTVSTLIIAIGKDEVRRFGCEVSSRRSGERTSVFSWYLDVRRNRMRSGEFQGAPAVTEVECSGSALPPNLTPYSLTLYTSDTQTNHNNNKNNNNNNGKSGEPTRTKVVCSVSLMTEECLTSDRFASCHLDRRDVRMTSVRALLLDLREGEEQRWGCEVVVQDDVTNRARIFNWSLLVRGTATQPQAQPLKHLF
ncbi:hypothetical protein ACOMHN_035402 [Nucella lapillus]